MPKPKPANMKYATPSQLIDRFDAGELVRVAVPKEQVSIDASLLKLTIAYREVGGRATQDAKADAYREVGGRATQDAKAEAEGVRDRYSAEERAAADAAMIKINRALEDASGEIDAHLEAKYQLPLSTVPLKLEQVCCDIARYALYDDQPTEHITKRYDDAIKYLLNVSRGVISLGIDETSAAPIAQNDVVDFTEGSNVFDRQTSKSFI